MSVAILTANLGGFDEPMTPVKQNIKNTFKCWDDESFPPIADLPPRFQYRIPKLFGWQMFPGFEYYIWLDGSLTLAKKDSAQWLIEQCRDQDFVFFKHPWRNSIKEETDHIEAYLKKGDKYITDRYRGGLHKEQYKDCMSDKSFTDDRLYASTAFVYRDSEHTRDVMRLWWLHQSRYYTCDQVCLPYVTKDSAVAVIDDNPFKCKYFKYKEHKK